VSAGKVETAPAASLGRFARSVTAKVVLLVVVFVAVPAALYGQFRAAEAEKRELVLAAIRDEGLIIARALAPVLERADSVPYVQLGEEIARYAGGATNLKLLFHPDDGEGETGFFYVASAPPVAANDLAVERAELAEAGILGELSATCAGDLPMAMQVEFPGGRRELLTSITPVKTERGCWALVVAKPLAALGGVGFGRPYWQAPEVQAAAIVYVVLALVVFGLFGSLWGSLHRFGRLAHSIGTDTNSEASFAARNAIPELDPVARDFDRMVATLRASAENLRRTAEETAHAFKTPIAVIRQSVEPLHERAAKGDDEIGQRCETIAAAAKRLEGLVQAMRRIDWATADLLDAPRQRIDLAAACGQALEDYAEGPGGDAIEADLEDGVLVTAAASAIETAVANLVENALGFTPEGGTVKVAVRAIDGEGVLTVEDDGPGVAADRLERIFERYYSSRQPDEAANEGEHFGIGLWIVRRNIEAMGGTVRAENRPEGGPRVRTVLPLA